MIESNSDATISTHFIIGSSNFAICICTIYSNASSGVKRPDLKWTNKEKVQKSNNKIHTENHEYFLLQLLFDYAYLYLVIQPIRKSMMFSLQ